jgi:signal transduction histidine kinase
MSHAERLTRLSEILVELFRSPVPTHFFQTLADQAFAVVPNDYLAVCLQDPEKGGYLVHSLARLEEPAVSQRVFSPDEGLPGLAISTGKADTKSIELHAELPDETIISAVPSRVRQVLINLIDNGIKYTPSGGRVTTAATVADNGDGNGTITIRVTDTGIGIPARDLPHVFDKFYRVKSKATKEIAGTGLGLAITRSIVEAYGGRIRAESIEGAGTTFVVDLPLAVS